jgi:hypothetical protein
VLSIAIADKRSEIGMEGKRLLVASPTLMLYYSVHHISSVNRGNSKIHRKIRSLGSPDNDDHRIYIYECAKVNVLGKSR